MQLSKLFENVPAKRHNWQDIEITSLEFDSRKVIARSLFIAMKGNNFDGHDFVSDAEKRGAAAIMTERLTQTDLPQIVVADTKKMLSELALKFYGTYDDLIKIGVTGTNGKTTTTFLIHSILTMANKHPGLIGTVYYLGKTKIKAERTTPEILDIYKLFEKFKQEGSAAVVMEVSSHALKLKRVENIKFRAVVFTNLSQDHLDFHKTMEDYKKAKLSIFSHIEDDGYAIFNNDDTISTSIKALHLKNPISYGLSNKADIWGRILRDTIEGLKVEVFYGKQVFEIDSKLIGEFNIYNILAAFVTGVLLGFDAKLVVEGIEKMDSVRGRMERIVDNIFVDFAHTPSALENALQALKKYGNGRLIIVFGCGGDRDNDKRPKMGAVASRLADLVVLTSDNPRSEEPGKIIEDIKKGMIGNNYKVIEDRSEAIKYALDIRDKDDVVLVAGKGHEENQIIKDRIIRFNDAEVIRACLEN